VEAVLATDEPWVRAIDLDCDGGFLQQQERSNWKVVSR
jgi:hypothetical protein